MTRSGRLGLAALAATSAGLGAVLLIRVLAPGDAAAGRLPAAARALPADALLLAGADVAALREAGLLETLRDSVGALPPALAAALSQDDVDRLYWAVGEPGPPGVLLALGRFDRGTPESSEETAPGTGGPFALRIDAGGTRLLAGAPEAIAAVARAQEAGQETLPAELIAPLDALPPTARAWVAAGPAAMARLRSAADAALPLPALPELTGAALGLEPGAVVGADLVVLAADEAGARRFAETARGALALAQLTARPEVRAALSELAVGVEAARVRVRLRLPPERLAELAALLRGALAATGSVEER